MKVILSRLDFCTGSIVRNAKYEEIHFSYSRHVDIHMSTAGCDVIVTLEFEPLWNEFGGAWNMLCFGRVDNQMVSVIPDREKKVQHHKRRWFFHPPLCSFCDWRSIASAEIFISILRKILLVSLTYQNLNWILKYLFWPPSPVRWFIENSWDVQTRLPVLYTCYENGLHTLVFSY